MPGAGSLTISPNDPVSAGAWGQRSGGPANPQQLNRYSYVLNNPVNGIDPSGHDCTSEHYAESPALCGGGGGGNSIQEPLPPCGTGCGYGKGAEEGEGGTSGGQNWGNSPLGETGNSVVPQDVHAFGGNDQIGRPRPPRSGYDIPVDENGIVPAQQPPEPNGASTFGDPMAGGLTGSYHRLRAGTKLPPGLGIVPDGQDVNPQSPHPPTHHTIYPTESMTFDQFTKSYQGLPWEYNAGKIGKPK